MTADTPHDADITTEAEFDSALGRLISEAGRNDVDPRGSWVYRNGGTAPDWEVMVLELEKGEADTD